MKYYVTLICIFLFAHFCTFADDVFGYISYSSYNLGDDIQSLAAKRFLPEGSIPIDREFMADFTHDTPVHTILNGWLMHTKDWNWYLPETPPEKSWPPAACVDPLLISIHITDGFYRSAFSEEGIAYFKAHAPVGARDLNTLRELQDHGIPSYFSGCLTLTLVNDAGFRNDIIYAVDLDQECLDYVRAHANSPVVALEHGLDKALYTTPRQRQDYARSFLEKYKRAKCVVTTKFHAAVPCLALETPVLLLNTQGDQYRFDGIRELMRNCSKKEFLAGEAKFDFNAPGDNPQDYLPLRENLIQTVTSWVQSFNAS